MPAQFYEAETQYRLRYESAHADTAVHHAEYWPGRLTHVASPASSGFDFGDEWVYQESCEAVANKKAPSSTLTTPVIYMQNQAERAELSCSNFDNLGFLLSDPNLGKLFRSRINKANALENRSLDVNASVFFASHPSANPKPTKLAQSLESASLPDPMALMLAEIRINEPIKSISFIAGLSAAGSLGEDDAIEYVYDRMHRLIENDSYDAVDGVLRRINVDRHKTSVLLSLLTVTALPKIGSQLEWREDFYNRVRNCLVHREPGEEDVNELLFGLE